MTNWTVGVIFAIFLGGCALYGAGCVLDRLRAYNAGHTLRGVGTMAWLIALVLLLVCIAMTICGLQVV